MAEKKSRPVRKKKADRHKLDVVQIPDEELGRQAVNSLRGYVYQVYESLAAWITLKEDETLLLEVAEDFAVLAERVLTATQVKDTAASGSVTLKTESVSDAIKALWRFQDANPNKDVLINYLTTANIGKEKGLAFPDGHTGLSYWRVAARESSDVEPLREALLTLNLLPEIHEFVKSASPEELQAKILCRIRWICGAEDIKSLEQSICDRLVYLGERRNLTPSDSERARDSLVAAVLCKIVDSRDRRLSRADFLRIFEKAVSISLPASTVRQLTHAALSGLEESRTALISAQSSVIDAADIPLPPRSLSRDELVSESVSKLGHSGALWLHGSSGTGKTVLALFIARRSERDWLLVQLRNCSAGEVAFRLRRAIHGSVSRRIGGVILDDFPTKHESSLRVQLSMLASEIHRMDGALVITSAKPPSPTTQTYIGENGSLDHKVPYLSREEVAELVTLAGGDPKKWAGIIHAFCGFGHPQLVQARISGLKQRGWPATELSMDLTGSAQDVVAEREATRERLLSELSDNARALLYRLTLVNGYFDRDLAKALADTAPPIQCPGEMIDTLLGPWVEKLAADRLRVSPLVGDAGAKTLSSTAQLEVHRQIVEQLIQRHPFPSDFLGMLLTHALCSRHASGLLWLAMAVIQTPDENRGTMSECLFALPLLDGFDDKPFFQDNTYISCTLRLAQFLVAAWGNQIERLPLLGDRLIAEARMLEAKEASSLFLMAAIGSVLAEPTLRLGPQKWMPLIFEFEDLLARDTYCAELGKNMAAATEGLKENWTIGQFLFAKNATSLSGMDDLESLFCQLDGLDPSHRDPLLTSLREIDSGNRFMVDSAWLSEMRKGDIDGIVAGEKYRRLAQMAERWGHRDIAVECEYARVVMIDEYANDYSGALQALDEAETKHPHSYRLARQRAKVYYRNNDYEKALATVNNFARDIPKKDHTERAFLLREAGICAAETEDLPQASDFFSEACEAASAGSKNLLPMAIGLKADRAVIELRRGNRHEALRLMCEALADAEQLDPEASLHEKFCTLMLGNTILWMRSQIPGSAWSGQEVGIVAGCCSNPDPHKDIMPRGVPPRLLTWYQLAELEIELDVDAHVLDELRKRTAQGKMMACELSLSISTMTRHIRSADAAAFVSALPEHVIVAAFITTNSESLQDQDFRFALVEELPMPDPKNWQEAPYLDGVRDAVLAFVASAVCSHRKDVGADLLERVVRIEGAEEVLNPFVEFFEKQPVEGHDVFEVVAACIGVLSNPDVFLKPDDLSIITFRLWEWVRSSMFREAVVGQIEQHIVNLWQQVIEEQRFLLRNPMTTVPRIEAALNRILKPVVRLAAVVIAAEEAVRPWLNNEMREQLKKYEIQGSQ